MDLNKLANLLAGMEDEKERNLFLLCLADEVPDEEKARWLRERVKATLSPVRSLFFQKDLWLWAPSAESLGKYYYPASIPDEWHEKTLAHNGGQYHDSPASAWLSLLSVLFK